MKGRSAALEQSLRQHRAHDYRQLMERWRAVARGAGLRLRRLASSGGAQLFALKTPALQTTGGMYVSAGIHGDEAASTEALITWAERHASQLARWPLMIFPCLNPWGLLNNRRSDAAGADLNRLFHRDDNLVISAVKQLVAGHQFEVALMLHEDYDAQGCYIYELEATPPDWGEELLVRASPHIAPDARAKIERRLSARGVIRRRLEVRRFEKMGYPEAIWLQLHHAQRSLTFETPSEFALDQRVAAHMAVLDGCLERLTAPAAAPAGRRRKLS